MDPTGVTLASISLFIQLIKTTDRLYAIYKAISSFDEDFREEQLKLQAQWIIYDNWVNVAELPSSRLPGGHLSEEDTLFVEEFLKLMERHFGDCNQLVGKYTGHNSPNLNLDGSDTRWPGEATRSRPTSPACPTSPVDTMDPGSPEPKLRGILNKLGLRNPIMSRASSPSPSPADLSPPPGRDDYARPSFARASLHGLGNLRRVKWSVSDKASFKFHLKEITTGNETLGSLFQSFKPPNPVLMLETYTATDHLWPQIDKLRAALGDLHRALRNINLSNTSPPAAKFHLSMKLSQDPNRSREDLEHLPSIASFLREDSCVVHALSYVIATQRPEALSFECRAISPAAANARRESLRIALDSLSPPETQDHQQHMVEYFGAVRAHGPYHEDHLVFRTKAQWTRSRSLLDVLRGDDYSKNMTKIQIVQLAQLVVSAHLSYEDVRASCAPVRPANLVYYETSEPANEWVTADPLVLRPWLDFGFGRIRDARVPGDFGVADTTEHCNIELGLLLFQIGSGQGIEYGNSPADLMQARKKHLEDAKLQSLRVQMGSGYVEAVQSLLEAEIVESELRGPHIFQREREHVRGVLASLYALKTRLNGAAAL